MPFIHKPPTPALACAALRSGSRRLPFGGRGDAADDAHSRAVAIQACARPGALPSLPFPPISQIPHPLPRLAHLRTCAHAHTSAGGVPTAMGRCSRRDRRRRYAPRTPQRRCRDNRRQPSPEGARPRAAPGERRPGGGAACPAARLMYLSTSPLLSSFLRAPPLSSFADRSLPSLLTDPSLSAPRLTPGLPPTASFRRIFLGLFLLPTSPLPQPLPSPLALNVPPPWPRRPP